MRAGTLPPPPELPLVRAFDPATGLPLGPSAADWLRLSPRLAWVTGAASAADAESLFGAG